MKSERLIMETQIKEGHYWGSNAAGGFREAKFNQFPVRKTIVQICQTAHYAYSIRHLIFFSSFAMFPMKRLNTLMDSVQIHPLKLCQSF